MWVHFFTPKQLSPFSERLELPFPEEEILSGCEEDISFIRDRFTTWVKADPNTTLERHVVDVRNALAEYREASARRHDTPAQEHYFDSSVPNRSSVQKWLSIYNKNPGPRRGTQGAIEKQIAQKWHIITLQEAIELSFLRIDSTQPIMEDARCYSTRTPSALMSMSNPSTFTIPCANCLIL